MPSGPQPGSDFRNAVHNFFNNPHVNLILTGALTIITSYFAYTTILHRHVVHPLTTNLTNSSLLFESYASSYQRATILFIMYLFALVAGKVASYALFPPMFGALIVGIIIRNVHVLEFLEIDDSTETTWRYLALTIILIRLGLSLDFELIATSWIFPIGFSVMTLLVEVAAVIISAHFIFGVPVTICFILGFILATTSNSVLVPEMRYFEKLGRGEEKRIPEMVKAANCVDNMLGAIIATILLTLVFSDEYIGTAIVFTIGEAVLAIIIGVLFGVALHWCPRAGESFTHFARTLLLLTSSLAFVFCAYRLQCLFTGVLATLVMSIVVTGRWSQDKDVDETETLTEAVWINRLWVIIFEPILFVLVGLRFSFDQLTWGIFFSGLAVVAIATAIRFVAAFALSLCNGFKMQEKLFVAFCSVPKGTLQASLGPTLVLAITFSETESVFIPIILSCLICSIAFAGCIGRLLVRVFGPFLLEQDFPDTVHIVNPTHNTYVETVKVDNQPDGLVTFKQFKTLNQIQSERNVNGRPYEF